MLHANFLRPLNLKIINSLDTQTYTQRTKRSIRATGISCVVIQFSNGLVSLQPISERFQLLFIFTQCEQPLLYSSSVYTVNKLCMTDSLFVYCGLNFPLLQCCSLFTYRQYLVHIFVTPST